MNKDLELAKNSLDLTEKEKGSLSMYIKEGLQGLVKIDESNTMQWFNLYMSGSSYKEIADTTQADKNMIMYISQRNGWHNKKMDYLNDVTSNFVMKTKQAKLEGANTVLLANMALGKYLSEEFQEFIKTGDKKIMERFDQKNFQNFLKAIESLDKILGRSTSSEGSNININISSDRKTDEKSNNDVEISAKTDNGETLALLAKYKKSKNN